MRFTGLGGRSNKAILVKERTTPPWIHRMKIKITNRLWPSIDQPKRTKIKRRRRENKKLGLGGKILMIRNESLLRKKKGRWRRPEKLWEISLVLRSPRMLLMGWPKDLEMQVKELLEGWQLLLLCRLLERRLRAVRDLQRALELVW